jgi:hypothetical protein
MWFLSAKKEHCSVTKLGATEAEHMQRQWTMVFQFMYRQASFSGLCWGSLFWWPIPHYKFRIRFCSNPLGTKEDLGYSDCLLCFSLLHPNFHEQLFSFIFETISVTQCWVSHYCSGCEANHIWSWSASVLQSPSDYVIGSGFDEKSELRKASLMTYEKSHVRKTEEDVCRHSSSPRRYKNMLFGQESGSWGLRTSMP